jgi:prepilin-type processing-associated H-X9-DG protein
MDLTQNQYFNALGQASPGAQVVRTLLCPADIGSEQTQWTIVSGTCYFGANSYGGNAGQISFFTQNMTQDGIFYINSRVKIQDITDGTSNTFLFGERLRRDLVYDAIYSAGSPNRKFDSRSGWAWTNWLPGFDYLFGASGGAATINWIMPNTSPPLPNDPGNIYEDIRMNAYGSFHPGGANFCFADGSVKFIGQECPGLYLIYMSTRAGQEVVDPTAF